MRATVARAAWRLAAHGAQRAPRGEWSTWLFLGGRGAGKTRAGAEWVWEVAEALGPGGRIALVGATLHDARAVMVEGPSGVMNLPFRSGLRFEPSLRRVVFPGGAVGMLFSAEEPERLRGPQFHAAWGDEFCVWGRGAETLAMLRLGLRLRAPSSEMSPRPLRLSASLRATSPSPGDDGEETERAQAASDRVASGSAPRLLLTSTPKPTKVLRDLLAEPGLVRTHAPTGANAGNLAAGFLAAMQALYGGTRRAAQELEGRVLEAEGALFRDEDLARAKGLGRAWRGDCGRVVVAVDPPAGTLSGGGRGMRAGSWSPDARARAGCAGRW